MPMLGAQAATSGKSAFADETPHGISIRNGDRRRCRRTLSRHHGLELKQVHDGLSLEVIIRHDKEVFDGRKRCNRFDPLDPRRQFHDRVEVIELASRFTRATLRPGSPSTSARVAPRNQSRKLRPCTRTYPTEDVARPQA